MKRHIIFITILALAGGLAACNKFLEVKPRGVLIPEKVADFEAVLNSIPMTSTFPEALIYMVDDYFGEYTDVDKSLQSNAYYWREELDVNSQNSPAVWGELYRTVYNANVIINNVMDAKDGTLQKKQQVLGEALLVKADAYFTMLTVFSKAYNPATAASDPGIPLMSNTDVTQPVPQRSRLNTCMDTIIADLKTAAEYLPVSNINRFRGTRYAAYGLMARVYLYMGEFDKSMVYADLALTAPHALLDYNAYVTTAFPVTDNNPEILWQRASDNYSIPSFLLYSEELTSYFSATDLRIELLTFSNDKGLNRGAPPGSANFGITAQEMYLSKAEALARKDRVTEAMDLVNLIRKNRIAAAAYKPVTAADRNAAIDSVLHERRRELAFSGLRWMDMKRLDSEGRMPLVKRIERGTGRVLAQLAPHSASYTFQVPSRVRIMNPDIEINK